MGKRQADGTLKVVGTAGVVDGGKVERLKG
jgi:hypothetical protein